MCTYIQGCKTWSQLGTTVNCRPKNCRPKKCRPKKCRPKKCRPKKCRFSKNYIIVAQKIVATLKCHAKNCCFSKCRPPLMLPAQIVALAAQKRTKKVLSKKLYDSQNQTRNKLLQTLTNSYKLLQTYQLLQTLTVVPETRSKNVLFARLALCVCFR
jgi:hypothetical protein